MGGGAFQSTDYSTLDRSLAIGELSFADTEHGWALHAKSVSRTQNGGASWQTQTSSRSTPARCCGLASSPSDAVWVVGSAGTMQKSADGGASWAAVDPATSQTLVDVAFGDASVGLGRRRSQPAAHDERRPDLASRLARRALLVGRRRRSLLERGLLHRPRRHRSRATAS